MKLLDLRRGRRDSLRLLLVQSWLVRPWLVRPWLVRPWLVRPWLVWPWLVRPWLLLRVSRHPPEYLGPERPLAFELAEHPHPGC